MKILITGAAGFIGSHLAERLKNELHDVIGVDNFSNYYEVNLKRINEKSLNSQGISIVEGDLRSGNLAQFLPTDVDYIFHCAAQPGIASTSSFEDYLTNNVMATQNLVEYAKSLSNLKMFVNIGTSSIYGKDVVCNEDEVPKPYSYYGVTKLAAEQLVLLQTRLENFPACSLRLYSVYGSRERPDKMFSQLIDCGLNNKPFPLFANSFSHKRSFTHIADIIDGIISVINNETACNNQIINIGTDQEYTTALGIQTVEKLLNTKISIVEKPARLGDQTRTKAIIDKATHLLHYKPQVTLEAGVQEQINWFLKEIKTS